MRDVSAKANSLRIATARSIVRVSPSSIQAMREGTVPKGDPLPVAKVAAIQAVKNTPQLIPYCHTVPIEHVLVEFQVLEDQIVTDVTVKSVYKTGVEMEAMAGAMIAALNIYDVLKMIDDDMEVLNVSLVSKVGGKSDWKEVKGWKFCVLVVSDSVSGGKRLDTSGELLVDRLQTYGGTCVEKRVVADSSVEIVQAIESWSQLGVNLVVTTGGTGLGPRDRTPEMVTPLFDRRIPGLEQTIHQYGQQRTPFAMLSRISAGVVDKCIVLTLPGSKRAVDEALNAVMPQLTHCFEILEGAGHE